MRCIYTNVAREEDGDIINDATITVYLAGTSTLASIYTTLTTTSATNSVTTNSVGEFTFYIDRFDYDSDQKFMYTVTKTGYTTKTYNYIDCDRIVTGTYTIAADKTVTTHLTIPKGVIYSVSSGITLTFSGNVDAGPYQIFTGSGTVSGLKESYPEWWGTGATAVQSCLSSLSSSGICKLSTGTYTIANLTMTTANTTLQGSGWGSILSSTLAATGDTPTAILIQANNVTVKDFKLTYATLPTALVVTGDWVTENNGIGVGWPELTGGNTLIENTVIDNVYILGGKTHGICLGETNNTVITPTTKIEGVMGTGVWGTEANNVRVGGRYYNIGDAAIDITSNDGYAENPIIENYSIEKVGVGIGLHGTSGGLVGHGTITNTWGAAIVASNDVAGGHVTPVDVTIDGPVISKPFQNYGVGENHTTDAVSEVGGVHGVIEAWVSGNLTIRASINDDAGLHANYRLIMAGGNRVDIKVVAQTDISIPFHIGSYGTATAADQVDHLTMTGNNVSISTGNGTAMILLNGVAEGSVTGNTFDCGTGVLAYGIHSTNVLLTANRISNATGSFTNADSCTGIEVVRNSGLAEPSATTTQIENDLHEININAKYLGKVILNTTTGVFLYAAGALATDHWYTLAGVDTYTPTH